MPPRQLFLFKFACWAAIVSAVAHLAGHVAGPAAPANDTERQILDLATNYRYALPGGSMRSLMDFMNGFGLMFALQLATMGAAGLVVAKRAGDDGPLMRALARTFAIGGAMLLVLSLIYFSLIPSMFLSTVALCYGMAAVSPPE
ncbi:MAG: hypothetical protein IT184_11395 [Acidobacteria bacterium]|nr:hypothetical protein [Acidobacteriota bacterium]